MSLSPTTPAQVTAKLRALYHQHAEFYKSVSVKSMIHTLTRNHCMRCAAEDKQKYTANFLEAAFKQQDHHLKVDLEKSQLTDCNSPIPADCLLTLNCAAHGALPETYKPYMLKKYLSEYQVSTPCRQCDPHSGNTLNSGRIRHYIESAARIKTHGALYRLIDTEQEIDANIEQIKEAGGSPYYSLVITLCVEATIEPPLLPTAKKPQFTIPYSEFRKGKRGIMVPGHQCSWLAKFIAFLNIEWDLGLQSEATFEGLKSENDNLLRIDFYQPTLQRVYEIDGSQHAAENQQIKSKADREAKFAAQQHRDNLVEQFFEAHEHIDLIHLNAYKKTANNNIKALRIDQQFDVALGACQAIYQSLYDTTAPDIDRHTLINTAKQNTSTLALQRINDRYEEEFTAQQISAKGEITLCCKHGHYMQISNAKFYLDAQLAGRSAIALCWGCRRQREIDIASRNLALKGWKITNEQQLRKQFRGSLNKPLKNRGAKSKIKLTLAPINEQPLQAADKPHTITLAAAQY